MGEVYRARDTNLKRDVAIKVLPAGVANDAGRLARLQREAEMLAALNHSSIAQIHGIERSDGVTAIVMELVDGPTLGERLAVGRIPAEEALRIALQIANALEAAHEQGIVHRDLKPANIKLKPDGTVKVLDFGIAKALDPGAASGSQPAALTTPAMTEAGVVLGTAAYMSPEQARGKPVDKRTDIWAFGCLLYEMLTGRPAFLADDLTTTLARVLEREPDLRSLPAGLAPAVRRTLELCLQKDMQHRLRDMGDVRLALEGGFAVPAAPARPLWRRALPLVAAFVAGALVIGAYILSVEQPALSTGPSPALPVTRFVITPPTTSPLANLGGLDLAISPDGQRLAYFAETPANGGVALYVRELDGLEARVIPGSELTVVAGTQNPFFSADGKSIGFLSPGRGVIRVAVDGTPPLKMFDAPQTGFLGASWELDDTVIFSSGNRLLRASARGVGTPEPLTQPRNGRLLVAPHLLPGGRGVLYAATENGVERIEVLDLHTGEAKTLVQGAHPTYVATGHLVFARGTTLMAAPFDLAELALTGEPVAMLQNVRHPTDQSAPDYALSATGTLAYVPASASDAGRATVVWVDRTGAVVARALPEPIDAPSDPRLSPNGEQLVLAVGPFGNAGLRVYDLVGPRPPILLAMGSNPSLGAVWNPDGEQVAFVTLGVDDSLIRTLAANDSELAPQPFPAGGANGMPQTWSAAAGLLFISNPTYGASDIRVVQAGGEARDVVATGYAEFDAALSPDGHWLAYASNRTGEVEVWVQSYPSGAPVQRISRSGGYEPRWSAEGDELFYLQDNALMAVAVKTEPKLTFDRPVELFSGPYQFRADPTVRTYDVARDGRFLMIQPENGGHAAPTSIVVVQNWFEELKQKVPR